MTSLFVQSSNINQRFALNAFRIPFVLACKNNDGTNQSNRLLSSDTVGMSVDMHLMHNTACTVWDLSLATVKSKAEYSVQFQFMHGNEKERVVNINKKDTRGGCFEPLLKRYLIPTLKE